MNLGRSLKTVIVAAIIGVASLGLLSPLVYAVESHQDPETARPVYSAISLLRYYSAALDGVLQKEPAQVEARLGKMPLANIPPSLDAATSEFVSSGTALAYLVADVEEDVSRWQALVAQSRFDEADELAEQVLVTISRAHIELNKVEDATRATDRELKASHSPEGSDLRLSYEEVLNRIERIRGMLNLYRDILLNLLTGGIDLTGRTELLELAELARRAQSANPTEITLDVEPRVAFVGDDIHFEGRLTGQGQPLAGMEVVVLLNGSPCVMVLTDADGLYRGTLTVPYWYVPYLDVQALYYPRGADVERYLASLSRVVTLEVLFYQAGLEITVEDRAYPGRETAVAGRFDYGQSPPLAKREVEIYLDSVLISEISAPEAFEQPIDIAPEAELGQHVITVSSAAVGRYAPVVKSAVVEVTRATPFLDLGMPAVAFIPGSINLDGKLYSEIGPLSNAMVKMELGDSGLELVSTEGGVLDGEIGVGMGFGVIGRQDLVVQVLPQEPWHSPLVTSRSLVMVNMVNCGGIIVILVLCGIYLPVALRRRVRTYVGEPVAPPVVALARYQPTPVYSQEVTLPLMLKAGTGDGEQPRSVILSWYRFVVRIIQLVTRVLLKPQQTLREFAAESNRVLGPAAKYFLELTRMVERLLYSRYRPTAEDAGKSRQLSRDIEEELKGEGV